MKKTVTVNISGIAFTIDEDAHDKLSHYLNTIRGYFSASDGRDEIMADIESRIAEMLHAKVSDKKHVINISDIEEVIALMGKPEQFAGEASSEKTEEKTSAPANESRTKRIFRDPDNKVLGGVCSGLGYYFGFDPLWLRIAFAVIFFAGFGSGLLVYILLWIIIPKANTTSEKLEMKGESVNVSNIGKAIEEEMDDLKKKVNEFSEKAKNINAGPQVDKAKNFISRVVEGILQLLKMLLKTFGKIFGIALLIAGTVLAIVFSALMLGEKAIISITPEGIHSFSWSGITNMIFGSSNLSVLATIGLIIILGIPIIGIFYAGIKLLFGIKNGLRGVGVALTALWFGGVIVCGVSALMLVSDFSEKGNYEKKIILIQPANNRLYLHVADDIFKDNGHHSKHSSHNFHLKINDDSAFFGNVKLDIEKSENDSFYLDMNFIARGESSKEAIELAKNINYGFAQGDSLINFNTYYSITNQKWRNQYVKMTLKVPEGKSVYLGEAMDQIIYDVRNTTNTLDYDMVDKTWVMTKQGLECGDCK